MKKLIILAVLAAISSLFISCKTLKEIPEEKTSAQIIQMGQNYASNSDYKSAIFCYQTVIERFGNNPAIYVEAQYELARIYMKQKKYEKAYPIFNEILDMYDRFGLQIPGTYKKLSKISIEQIPAVKLQELQSKNEYN